MVSVKSRRDRTQSLKKRILKSESESCLKTDFEGLPENGSLFDRSKNDPKRGMSLRMIHFFEKKLVTEIKELKRHTTFEKQNSQWKLGYEPRKDLICLDNQKQLNRPELQINEGCYVDRFPFIKSAGRSSVKNVSSKEEPTSTYFRNMVSKDMPVDGSQKLLCFQATPIRTLSQDKQRMLSHCKTKFPYSYVP